MKHYDELTVDRLVDISVIWYTKLNLFLSWEITGKIAL